MVALTGGFPVSSRQGLCGGGPEDRLIAITPCPSWAGSISLPVSVRSQSTAFAPLGTMAHARQLGWARTRALPTYALGSQVQAQHYVQRALHT